MSEWMKNSPGVWISVLPGFIFSPSAEQIIFISVTWPFFWFIYHCHFTWTQLLHKKLSQEAWVMRGCPGNFRTNPHSVIVTRDIDSGTVLDFWMLSFPTTLSVLGVTQPLKANHSACWMIIIQMLPGHMGNVQPQRQRVNQKRKKPHMNTHHFPSSLKG